MVQMCSMRALLKRFLPGSVLGSAAPATPRGEMVDRPGAQRRQQFRTPAIYFETEFVLLGEMGLRLTMSMSTILA